MSVEEGKTNFHEADRRYAELRREHESGNLGDEEFDDRLKQLMVQDEEGRWWGKSRTTGDWHYHDGTAWVKDTPPGYQAPQAAPEDQPETQQSESLEAQELARRLADIYAEGQRRMDAEEWKEALEYFEDVQRLEPGYRDTEELLLQSRQRLSANRTEQAGRNDLAGARLQNSQAKSQPNTSTESVQANRPHIEFEQQNLRKIYEVIGIMALVIAGILWIGFSYWSWWFLISPTTYESSSVSLWVLRLALILTLAGLVELHMRHATSYGRLGLAAVLVTSLGIILTFVYGFLGSASIPLLLAMLLPLDLGLVLYGVAISQAGVLPRQLGWLLAGSGVIGAVSNSIRPFTRGASATDTSVKILVVSDVIFLILAGLCWVLLGYALWRQRIAIHDDNNKN